MGGNLMGRWANWKPGQPPPPPVQYPISSQNGRHQGIDHKRRLVLNGFEQGAPPNTAATEKGENLGIPPFLAGARTAPTPFEHSEHFEQGIRDPEICTNEQTPLETVFPWGLDKKRDSGGIWREAPACSKCSNVQKPSSAEFDSTIA